MILLTIDWKNDRILKVVGITNLLNIKKTLFIDKFNKIIDNVVLT